MSISHSFQWTAENIETMRRLRAEGHSAAEIARTLKAPSRNAVLGKMHRLGMGERKAAQFNRHRESSGASARTAIKRPRLDAAAREDRRRKLAEENAAARKARAEARRGSAEVEAMRAEQAAAVNRFMPEWANVPLPDTKPVKLVDLETRSCRWPLDTDKGIRYCGCTTERVGLSYCPSHQAVHTSAATRTPDQVRIVAEMMPAPINLNSQP